MRRFPTLLAALSIAALLSACAPTVSMAPAADDANNPACADAVVRMPDTIESYPKRTTDAQGTVAWGNPTVALLYCGVPVPEVSALECIEYQGIYWLREEVDAGYAFTTYGRDPAIRIVVDDEIVGGPGVALDRITTATSFLPENGSICLDTEDTVTPSN